VLYICGLCIYFYGGELKKLYKVLLVAAVSIMLSSDQPHHNAEYVTDDIRVLPPTFITLKQIDDCVPSAGFPQRVSLPFFSNAVQVQFSCDYYDKDHVAWAMYVFYEEWNRTYGDEGKAVRHAMNNLEIQWGRESRQVSRVYDINGNFLRTASVVGLMLSPTSIWASVENNISDTSLVHELVHIALKAGCGDADPDHEGESFECWEDHHSVFIDNVNNMLNEKYGL